MVAGTWIRYAVFVLLLLVCTPPIATSGESDRLVKIAEDVYARIVSPNGDAVGNSGFIILEQSVIVFDTHFTPEEGLELRKEIESVTARPVRYVVNSHHHPDHTHGNQVFPEAHIIGSRGTRRNILENDLPSLERIIQVVKDQLERMKKEESGLKDPGRIDSLREQITTRNDYLQTLLKLTIMAPFVVLDEYLAITEGSSEARILFMGPGHSDNDTVLFLPADKVLFCGSLLFNDAIPSVQDAKMLQWMDVLHEILEFDADRFIPGHGPPGDRQDVEKFIGYFEDLRALVEPFVARGESLKQAMQDIQLPAKYSRYRFKDLFPSNVQKMYEELKMQQLLSIPIEGPQRPQH